MSVVLVKDIDDHQRPAFPPRLVGVEACSAFALVFSGIFIDLCMGTTPIAHTSGQVGGTQQSFQTMYEVCYRNFSWEASSVSYSD